MLKNSIAFIQWKSSIFIWGGIMYRICLFLRFLYWILKMFQHIWYFFVFNLRESSFIVFYFDERGIYYQKQILCCILMTFWEIINLQWMFYSKLLKNQELCFKCCRNAKCCHSHNFWNLLLVLYFQSMMSSNRYKEKQKIPNCRYSSKIQSK